jgi:hypothetical protein
MRNGANAHIVEVQRLIEDLAGILIEVQGGRLEKTRSA